MGGLLDSLSTANTALTTFRLGLDVTGQNIANINTPGYARRSLSLAELPPVDGMSAGRGVEVVAIRANRDQHVLTRIGREQAGLAKDAAILDGVGVIEAEIGLPGSSIDARLTALFDAFSEFANDVTSPSARDNVVRQGQLLGQAFAQMSGGITQLQRTSDAALRDSVAELNQLASTVAQLNAAITTGGPDIETLVDSRNVALGRMAELADVSVTTRSDGAVDVSMAQGRALVIGAHEYPVDVVSGPPSGYATLHLAGTDVTSAVTNGRIGGLIELRDSVLPRYQTRLDQLAYDVATGVNAAHASGFDANGVAAGNFFTPLAGVAGAAQALTVDAAVAADSQLVAGSATGASGDNQTARALAALRTAPLASGGTASASVAWSNLVYEVGSDVSTAKAASTTREQVVRQLERLRDQASGVSLDEEAANLMRFQRSYEASARYFTTIVDTLDTLMAMVR